MGSTRTFTAAGTASGIGDLTVRLKGSLAQAGPIDMAAGIGVKLAAHGCCAKRSHHSER